MKRIYFFIFFTVIYNLNFTYSNLDKSWNKKNITNKAVIIAPVVDAVSQPFSKLTSNLANNLVNKLDKSKSVKTLYKEIPYAPQVGEYSCCRLHQVLFNEVVTLKKSTKDEVECELSSLFYYDFNNRKKRNFWVLKKYIRPLNLISNLEAVPRSYCDNNRINNSNILTLKAPWKDNVTRNYYSAGTRFVRNKNRDLKDKYCIVLLDNSLKKCISYVPKKCSVINYHRSNKLKVKLFLNLVKKWTNKSGNLPYVWGGCSYIKRFKNNDFTLQHKNYLGQNISFWMRPDKIEKPYTGFECSSLILRAIQIYGLPYFCKNTTALSKTLRPLGVNEKIEEGDLIWYKGHVLIVSNINKSELIESVGYSFGYGKLHQLKINKIFKNINNYDDLLKKYYKKKPLRRLDNKGLTVRNIPYFLILKLSSIF